MSPRPSNLGAMVEGNVQSSPQRSIICYHCRASGHVVRNCPNRNRSSPPAGVGKEMDQPGNRRQLSNRSLIDRGHFANGFGIAALVSTQLAYAELEINHKFVSALLDSGAYVNFISRSVLEQLMWSGSFVKAHIFKMRFCRGSKFGCFGYH